MRGRVAVLVVAVLATLLGSAIFASSVSTWGGYYLRTSDSHKIHYNAVTGDVTDLGIHIPPNDFCTWTWDPDIRRCGACDHYAPAGETTWEYETTQYTYDRCESLDANDLNDVIWRADLRVYDGPESYWPAGVGRWVEARAEYYRGAEKTPVDQNPPPCSSIIIANAAQLTTCESHVRHMEDIALQAPVGTDSICYLVEFMVRTPSGEVQTDVGRAERCYSSW